MRLQSLEIKGFKSFADRTVLNFNNDVVGIVGPNGCGKSNVVDAIRWVLGEQKSKELRSDKMESVIFNGTKQRKQGGVAEVTMTLENTKNILPTEYTTVTITRILYRSGESEYKLNGVNCRLKDINNLLMDTGIGSNSYAIIALGMVDDLLADRENSRRRLFEQAAGVSKYKARKHETMSKLKGTEEDLSRVEDLLHEIDGQLKILEKQAKRAQKWVEMKEEYRTKSLELAKFRLSGFKVTFKTLKEKIQKEETELIALDALIATQEAKLSTEKNNNLDKEKSLSDRQRELNSLVGRIRGMENDKKVLEQKIDFLQRNTTETEQQLRTAQARLTQLADEVTFYRGELNGEKRLEAALDDALTAAETALANHKKNHAALKSDLDTHLQAQQIAEKQLLELEKQRAVGQTTRENLQQDITAAQADTERRQTELDTVKTERDGLHKKQTQQQRFLEDLEDKEEERKENLAQAEQQLAAAQKNLNDYNRSLDAKRNEYKLTKSLVESLEGFPESIKYLSKDKDWAKRVPLLSDVLYCKPDFRVALENYLEAYLNFYIAPDLATAADAIRRLTDAQRGRANFFVLNQFIPTQKTPEIQDGLRSAWSVVECDEAYKTLFNTILNNVYIIDNEQDIIDNELSSDTILLSKNGGLMRGERTLGGGSVGLFEGKRIGRKKSLEVLETEIKDLESTTKTVQRETVEIQERIDKLKKQNQEPILRREREELNILQQQIVSLSARLEGFQSFLDDALRRKTQAESRISQITLSETDLVQKISHLQTETQLFATKITDSDSSYRQVTEALSLASADYNSKNIELIKQQNKIQSLQTELSFRERQTYELNTQTAANQILITRNSDELRDAQDEIDALTRTLQEKMSDRKQMEQTLTQAEQTYYNSRTDITSMEEQMRTATKSKNGLQTVLQQSREQFNDVKLQLTSISERLRIEFSVEVNDIINQDPDLSLSENELTEYTQNIKKRLDVFGEVNPMAIEAYNEIAERAAFITTQRDDLVAAKTTLLDTISEIETTAKARFMDAFVQVREHFIRVFRSLFTEDDSCDLVLSTPENPLESHIEIIAKPKGKRPQTINQLSGGEKTLTATALLFSLYLLKPAPFCIFDEVDAPLDDANIDKFNNIIKEFSQNSQFIIVTHNKQTMASVDVIYGVSMVEQGVSRVLPVDFRSLN